MPLSTLEVTECLDEIYLRTLINIFCIRESHGVSKFMSRGKQSYQGSFQVGNVLLFHGWAIA